MELRRVGKCVEAELFQNIMMTMRFPEFMTGTLGNVYVAKRVNVSRKVLYFTVWEVRNLVYSTVEKEYFVVTSARPCG